MRLILLSACLLGIALAGNSNMQKEVKPFGNGNKYIYQYNAQICSGLIAQSEKDQADPQQKASIQIQAQALLTFTSDRHAQLQLQQIRVGQLNEQLSQPEQVQPMAIFEPKQLPKEHQIQLEEPCQFSYADGVIDRVQFAETDSTWSKNIKRAVLNMIQLNLKRNNAQGLQQAQDEEFNNNEEGQNTLNDQLSKLGKTFSIPEIMLEGACQATYTINQAAQQQQQQAFNVTKTIDFKQCSKIADVAYGFQTEQPQSQCAGCQQFWYNRQLNGAKQGGEQQGEGQQCAGCQQSAEHNQCAQCDPKEVKEQTLDRSTVYRYQLACQSANCHSDKKYGLKRTELLSQYVYKTMKAQNGKYSSALHTVVAATLRFRSVQRSSDDVPAISSSNVETVMFSNQWDVDVKRFYMFGDEEFPAGSSSSGNNDEDSNTPFYQVPKVKQAAQALRKVVEQITSEKENGIEPKGSIEVKRLVEMLRMCSTGELKQIEQNAEGQMREAEEKQTAKHIIADALAMCGTRNCVQRMAEKIQTKAISEAKAIQMLHTLNGVPAPSDSILAIVKRLCQHKSVQQQCAVKQSCWLTYGALVNELCQHKTQKGNQAGAFGSQSGFDKQEQCPSDKKQQYKETILAVFKSANSIQEKVLALNALGNAGIDTAVSEIEQIIKDRSESRVVRYKAIDALRRLRTQMAVKIQQILLPIYLNTREHPEIRAYAFARILSTLPGQQVIDQLAYTIRNENNRQVQAFAYRAMKTLANSRNPVERQISEHIKTALKLTNVDEQELRNSGKWQIPVYSEEMAEGMFINLAQIVSSRSAAPAFLHAQINTFINDQYKSSNVKVYMVQQETEQWYQKGMAQLGKQSASTGGNTRGRRSSSSSSSAYGQSLRDIYSALGIKSRRSSYSSYYNNIDQEEEYNNGNEQQQQQQPFAMLCMRTGDVDHCCVSISEQNMPETIQKILNGEQKPSLIGFLEKFQREGATQFRGAMVTSLFEQEAKIPTSAGLPLRICNFVPVLASANGQAKISMESARLDSPLGAKAEVNTHIMASLGHIKKMECRLPFAVSGVETIHTAEINAPLNAEVNASPSKGVVLKLKLPRASASTTLLGIHSLPLTYTASVEPKTQLVHEPRNVKTVHNPRLDRQQHEVNKVACQTCDKLGIPLHVQGYYHWPAERTSYQQFLQLLHATENIVHVVFKPDKQQTPREVLFQLSAATFQGISSQEMPFHEFYTKQIGNALDSDEIEEMELDSHDERRQKLQNFLGQYQPKQEFKHSLRMSAQTVGGQKQCKAEVEVQTICDEQGQACKMQLDVKRSPIGDEGQQWTMSGKAQLMMPQTVTSQGQLKELEGKNSRLQCQAEVEWGTGGRKQQQISIRIQGEQAKKQQWRQSQGQQQQKGRQQQQQERSTAFLNKFDLEANYQLKPQVQNVFVRALELVKSAYFWNSQSQLTDGEEDNNNNQPAEGSQNSGRVLATVIIDPITQKHANATIKTPNQIVRFQQVELPFQCRPFALVRQQRQQTRSISQFILRTLVSGRAECTVDGREVNTFDDVEYSAPFSTDCYSVLAKDCSPQSDNEPPQFAVLMKALESGKNGQKKLKLISPYKQIECQQQKSGSLSSGRILCKVNGTPVNNDDDNEEAVDFNNAQQSDVTVHVPGISVRFNGRKAWLKVSSVYKNSQCGLCGHYDDSSAEESEWRMGNNRQTNDLAKFHRSYALQGTQEDECSAEELNAFYQKHGSSIRRHNTANNDEENEEESQEQEWDNEQFNGEWENEAEEGEEEESWSTQSNGKTSVPTKKTRVLELNHQLCFSQQPVKQCPKGTVPKYGGNDANDSQQDQEENNDKNEEEVAAKNVRFACLERSSSEARRLLRELKRGNNSLVKREVQKMGTSFSQKVREPKQCARNRY